MPLVQAASRRDQSVKSEKREAWSELHSSPQLFQPPSWEKERRQRGTEKSYSQPAGVAPREGGRPNRRQAAAPAQERAKKMKEKVEGAALRSPSGRAVDAVSLREATERVLGMAEKKNCKEVLGRNP
jgi:hypothetical protein